MQEFAWFRACAATLAADREFFVVAVGTPSHVSAIAPLARKRDGAACWELIGDDVYEPLDFVYEDPAALIPLAQALARAKIPLLLKRVPADSPVVEALQQAFRWKGFVLARPVPGCPWVALDADWLEPESRLSPGRRSDLRRARRIAETMGPVRCEILSPLPAELGPWLDEAFRIEAAGWKGRTGSALACDAERGLFYRGYAAAAARKGILRLCFLRIGGTAAAMQLAVEHGQRFWLFKIGYDEAFARCSPGTLLVAETIRYAAARGLCSYEFLGSVEPWTRMWTCLERPCVSLRAYPAAGKGMAVLAADVAASARRGVSRVVEAIRA